MGVPPGRARPWAKTSAMRPSSWRIPSSGKRSSASSRRSTSSPERSTSAYNHRYRDALSARADAYTQALKTLQSTPGWEELDEDQRPAHRRAARKPRRRRARPSRSRSRSCEPDLDACPARLGRAVEELLLIQEGARLVKVNVGSYFSGGIESEEQLTPR